MTEPRARGRVALVTGGSRGIGLGIAKALVRDGCDLAICGRRDDSAVSDVVSDLRELGRRVMYCRADIGRQEDRAKLIACVREHFDQLDVLVNNAGISSRVRADILEATEESFDELVRVNLRGPYFLTQTVARWMIDQKRENPSFTGCIVNISSISAIVASVNRGDYCISKAGLSMSTKLWAVRLAEFGISVYEVRPGIVSTDMTASVREMYNRLIGEGLLLEPRWGLPEDVGKVVATLVRCELPYCGGQVITVDGGLTLPRL